MSLLLQVLLILWVVFEAHLWCAVLPGRAGIRWKRRLGSTPTTMLPCWHGLALVVAGWVSHDVALAPSWDCAV